MNHVNGGAVVGMLGKDCVGIACDMRLGMQNVTVSTEFDKIFQLTDKSFVGLVGLATDVLTVRDLLNFRLKLYSLREEREMSPKVLSSLMGNILYERRFAPWFVSPIVAGLDADDKPFLTSFDYVGGPMPAPKFAINATCTHHLHGCCEAFYKPDMGPDELFESLSQSLMASLDRDALSGWGALVYIITPTQVIKKRLKSRMD